MKARELNARLWAEPDLIDESPMQMSSTPADLPRDAPDGRATFARRDALERPRYACVPLARSRCVSDKILAKDSKSRLGGRSVANRVDHRMRRSAMDRVEVHDPVRELFGAAPKTRYAPSAVNLAPHSHARPPDAVTNARSCNPVTHASLNTLQRRGRRDRRRHVGLRD